MNLLEQQFYRYMRDKFPGHVQRIENTVGVGMPDLNLCHNGREVWIELKVFVDDKVLLRKEQHAWMSTRAKNGGDCYVFALDVATQTIWVWQYKPHLSVLAYGTANKYVAICDTFPSQIPKWIDAKDLEIFLFPES